MGLCKCPKRKVTNLFCFEHRVNVCEYCLIENHPRCIVQSYLNWLKDSDYSPNCALCNVTLTEGEVIRLLCYDVFHLNCLEKHFRALPSNTAPAGYRCYSCDFPVFPAANQAGYVTERLREVLSKYNWARVGLCLPLIDEPPPLTSAEDKIYNYADDPDNDSLHGSIIPTTTSPVETFSADDFTVSQSQTTFNESYQTQTNYWEPPKDHNNHQLQSEKSSAPRTASTILPVETMVGGLDDDDEDIRAVSRKILSGPTASPLRGISLRNDPDGPDKYKRRSAFTWLKRWLKSRMLRGRSYHDGRALPRRTIVILLIGLLALLTFIAFATKVGRRSSSANDPNFDPHFNPNIHIAQGRVLDPDGNAALDVVDPLQAVQPVAGGV